ncbi:MAG: peptidoglycan-binding protein [Clostridia bacterium]|nr:peptidoglycan-binding protein [Clostridia bacterium]
MKIRMLVCCLCACLLIAPALGEDTAERVIAPAYPVPDYVEWLLDTAREELGTAEGRGNATKYGAWAGNPTAEWCAEFLCWCVHQTESAHGVKMLDRLYPNYTGTNTGRDWYLNQGRYVARRGIVRGWGTQWFKGESTPMAPNSYVPQPGDWMFLSNAATWDTTHVAMVEYCAYDAAGQVTVHVIEGNSPFAEVKNAVVRNSYPIDYWAILGYGTVNDVADIVMRFGNKGAKVTALQEDLLAAGIFPQGQKVTGQYGAITERCIKTIQQQMGAEETGIADHATQLELKRLVYGVSIDNPENWVDQN